jgi:hypothetical protein
MKTFPPDPLSNEERELARLLARLAPHGVPSPEIDARILSASHDAVAGPRTRPVRPRWPVAMGLAASMVLAVGVAWQLRPTQPTAGDQESASTGAWPAADAPAAPPAPEARTQPAPAPTVADEPPAAELRAAAADSAAAPPAARVVHSPKAPAAPVAFAEETPPPAAAPPQKNLVPPPPPRPVAPPAAAAPSVLPSGSVQQSKSLDTAGAQRQDTLRQAQVGSATEADSTAEASTGMRRELRVAPISERVQESASASEGHTSRTRRTDLQVPVAADSQLQVGDWLERVRTRYGLGDEEAARRSLLLFVQDHPTEPVPGDLEPLLDE